MGVFNWLAPWTTALVFLAPLLLPRLPGLVAFANRCLHGARADHAAVSFSTRPRPAWSTLALVLIAVHTAYHLERLVRSPTNVFRLTGLPLFATPISRLRGALLAHGARSVPFLPTNHGGEGLSAAAHQLSDSTLVLLQKLQSFDARALYAKYGSSTLVGCTWCDVATPVDYSAFWAVKRAVATLGETSFWAALTEGPERRRWRKSGAWVLALAGLVEAVWTFTFRVQTSNGDGFDLFTRMHFVRHGALLLLPLALHLLPPAPPPPPTVLASLPPMLQSAEALLSHVKMLEVSRLAVTRNADLRERLAVTGERMEEEAAWGREGAGVKEAGEAVGLTGELGVAGGLQDGARRFIDLGRRKVQQSLSRHA